MNSPRKTIDPIRIILPVLVQHKLYGATRPL